MSTKSEGKSNLIPFEKGPNPRRGRGPKKGAPNAGRPPLKLKEMLASLRMDPAAQLALLEAARNSQSANFRAAWTIATQYDEEAPSKKVEHSGTIKVRHEEAEQRFQEIVGVVAQRRQLGS